MTHPEQPTVDIAVLGGGLAGLAAARAIREAGRTVVVLERSSRVGGRVHTEIVGGTPLDVGAQFISAFYGTTIDLVREIGLGSQLVSRSQRAYLVDQTAEQGLWPARDLMSGHALSAAAKARLLLIALPLLSHWKRLDIADLARSADFDRQSAARYLRRLTGRQNLDNFFGPLLRGLLYWDADTTGIAVVLAILKAFATSSGTYRVNGGIDQIPQALAAQVDVRTNSCARLVARSGDEFVVTADSPAGDTQIRARSVLCATTASGLAGMLPWLPSPMAQFLRSIGYSSTAMLSFQVSAEAREYPSGALLFPLTPDQDIASVNPLYEVADTASDQTTAVDMSSRIVNIFLSDSGYAKLGALQDAELGRIVLSQVEHLLSRNDWVGDAKLVNVQRWPEALPRFGAGHIRAVQQFRNAQSAVPRLVFAGDYLDGPYIDAAVRSGQDAARTLIGQLAA